MSNFIDDFFEAEDELNENTRFLIDKSHQNGLTWPMYEKHEKALNNYFYKVKKIISSHDFDFYTLLRSKDAEVRMVALKLIKDGLLDVCIIKPFPLYSFPLMGIQMFNKTAHKSKFVEIIKGKEIKIIRDFAAPVHLDGEPENMDTELHVNIRPLSLTVLN